MFWTYNCANNLFFKLKKLTNKMLNDMMCLDMNISGYFYRKDVLK